MIDCAWPVFLLMLGATLIGGWLAWLLARRDVVDNSMEVAQLRNQLAELQNELDRLSEYSSTFHSEKRMLHEENETLEDRVNILQSSISKLTKDKAFLMTEFNRVNMALEDYKSEKQIYLDSEDTVAGSATDDSEVNHKILEKQLHDIQNELIQWKTKYQAIQSALSKKEKRLIDIDELSKSDQAKSKKKRWEVRYKKLKLKLLAVTKERDVASTQLETMKAANDRLLTELLDSKANIVQPKKERSRAKEQVFDRIKKRKDLLDFHRIGKSESKEKDDLKKISGVGPFIEKKLNALGIFKFEQLAKLTDDDISEIIKIIEVPSGIIKGADWIEQAKNMK
ncbi:MAG: hypothetical protein AB8F74_18580 [Saprospiraceae bacterium]